MRTTRRQISRTPVVLIVMAAVLMGGKFVSGSDPQPQALPDPAQMAVLAQGRMAPSDIVEMWRDESIEHPTVAVYRTQLASAQLDLAAQTGQLGLYEEAESDAEAAVALDPTSRLASLTLAASQSGQHDFSNAIEVIRGVLNESPDDVAALLAAGDTYAELGQYSEAQEAYQRASLELEGPIPALLSREARLTSVLGDSQRAVALARSALIGAADIDLTRADAAYYWFQLAYYQFQTGLTEEAEHNLRAALSVDPQNLGATELLAKVASAQGKDLEAAEIYAGLISRGPAPDLHGELAKVLRRLGQEQEAEEQIALGLKLATETADRFPAERRHLIGFLSDHNPAEAVRLAKLDLESRQDVYSHAWYAWALLQNGDKHEALLAIGPALAHGTDDPWLLYQAGAIHAANGDLSEASVLLSRALGINPQFDIVHADRARALLATISQP